MDILNILRFVDFSITVEIFSSGFVSDHVSHPYVIAFNVMEMKRQIVYRGRGFEHIDDDIEFEPSGRYAIASWILCRIFTS